MTDERHSEENYTAAVTSLIESLPVVTEADWLDSFCSTLLPSSIKPSHLLVVPNALLFSNLPLVLGSIRKLGENGKACVLTRDVFMRCVEALRIRVSASRQIKLRFLLLLQCESFSEFWNVTQVMASDAYESARIQHVEALVSARDAAPTPTCGGAGGAELATTDSTGAVHNKHVTAMTFSELISHSNALERWARYHMFHQQHGIQLHTRKWRMTTYREVATGVEITDYLMEHLNLKNRAEAVAVGEHLRLFGVLSHVSGPKKAFVDQNVFYRPIGRVSDRSTSAISLFDAPLSSTMALGYASLSAIRRVEMQILVDIIDLQSLHVWGRALLADGLEVGDAPGFSHVTHPMAVGGIRRLVPSLRPLEKPEARVSDEMARLANNSLSRNTSIDSPLSPRSLKSILSPRSRDSVANLPPRRDSTDSQPAGARGLPDSETDSLSLSSTPALDESMSLLMLPTVSDEAVVGIVQLVEVKKVFSSLARPVMVACYNVPEGAPISNKSVFVELSPRLIAKKGDNLIQDMCAEQMFRVFNLLWMREERWSKSGSPFIETYEVFPTGSRRGLMEAVPSVEAFKDFDWAAWMQGRGQSPSGVNMMLRSAAGAYIGAYVLGIRDRHWDNILLQDSERLLHIDFGFLLGNSPPIDAPRFSISTDMESTFRKMGVWDTFVDLAGDAFLVLRQHAAAISRAVSLLFVHAGIEEEAARDFIRSDRSLNVRVEEEEALQRVKRLLHSSSSDWQTKFKALAHNKLDPAWYGLLKLHFPPAVMIMKAVETQSDSTPHQHHDQKKTNRSTVVTLNPVEK